MCFPLSHFVTAINKTLSQSLNFVKAPCFKWLIFPRAVLRGVQNGFRLSAHVHPIDPKVPSDLSFPT